MSEYVILTLGQLVVDMIIHEFAIKTMLSFLYSCLGDLELPSG